VVVIGRVGIGNMGRRTRNVSKILVKIDASTPGGLRRLRDAYGLNLDEVAKKAGLDPSWLSRAERGFRPMTPEQMAAIRAAIEALADGDPQ